jgi:DNA-directed RNA polymerase subunit beta'
MIRKDDCNSTEGIYVETIMDGKQVLEELQERLVGKYLLEDYKDPNSGEVICDTNTPITEDISARICEAGAKRVGVRSEIGCKSKHGVCAKCYGVGLTNKKKVNIGEAVGIIAAQSIGEPGTQLTMQTFHEGGIAGGDITQGLPRVEELFEARNPKGVAIISEIAGVVQIKEDKKRKEVIVTSKDNSKTYVIPFGNTLAVKDGDEIDVGSPITVGSINPNELLAIKGTEAVYEYIISEVQKVYRNQGIDINDKHIEVITKQMLKKVRITDPGDSDFYMASLIDLLEFEEKNKELVAEGKRPAVAKRVLLGITKSSLATDSFLSAASFQETTKVLTDAAIKGKVDTLMGLKENVIIGKLIPAGTGLKRYRDISLNTKYTPPAKEEKKEEVNQ